MDALITTRMTSSPHNGCETSSRQDSSRQATLTQDQSSMFDLLTSPDIRSTTSSQASRDGLLRSVLSDGLTSEQSGPEAAHASHSRQPESAGPEMTKDISGQSSIALSRSASLQSSLASRLQARLDVNGSLEYELTWKHWDIAAGAADLCAASVGAPHPRQRLYWVADIDQARRSNTTSGPASAECHGIRADGMGWWLSHWDRDGEQGRFKDGSQRRTKSGVGIMVDGFPGRVGTVGSLGNAIVPQVAAQFILASQEAIGDLT